MNTLDFFDAVLPSAGRRCMGVLSNGVFQNKFYPSNKKLTEAVNLLKGKGREVYFGVASFDDLGKRTQTSARALRVFILDIDTREGKPDAPYATRFEAIAAVKKFCKKLQLPMPMIVSSAYGIHCYWIMDADITPEKWQLTANLLKDATKLFGLQADPSRTADCASVLRPVGTDNYKKDEPKEVQLWSRGDGPTSHAAFHLALAKFTNSDVSFGIPGKPDPRLAGNNDELAGPPQEYAPSDAHKIAEQCAAIAHIRDTGGAVSEPFWYGALGVLCHTTQGDEICHEWSKGDPRYSRRATQKKINQARANGGPTTCKKLGDHFAGCAACPHWGTRLKSPISLGETVAAPTPAPASPPPPPNPTPAPTPKPAVAPVQVTVQAPPPPPFPWPYGWGVADDSRGKPVIWVERLEETGKNDEGQILRTLVKHTVLTQKLVAIKRVATTGTDKLYSMQMQLTKETGDITEFALSSGLVADTAALFKELAEREVPVVIPKEKTEVQKYLAAWIDHLRQHHNETPSITQFGWHGEDFIIGEDRYYAGGVGKALVRDSATAYVDALKPRGNLDQWIDDVNTAYNHYGLEPLQFCVLAAFAAPLWDILTQETGGVVVYAHSAGSGVGKTFAQKVGLSVWGKPAGLLLAEGQFTTNFLYGHLGTMQHLPVVVDEFTNSKPEFASELVFSVSNGRGKGRMTKTAQTQQPANWGTIVMSSGNSLITSKLAMNRANAAAEMSRVWEFTLGNYQAPIDKHVAKPLFKRLFDKNCGLAGRVYIEYVVNNLDKVRRTLEKVQERFDRDNNITQAERFWSSLHTSVLTANGICRKLGLLSFDQSTVHNWIKNQLKINRTQIGNSTPSMLDQFHNMLIDLQPCMITTIGPCGPNGTPLPPGEVFRSGAGAVTGRVILADDNNRNVKPKIFIVGNAAKDWCANNGVSHLEMYKELMKHKLVSNPQPQPRNFGSGTVAYASLRARVWDIDPEKMGTVFADTPLADKVSVIRGGKDGLPQATTP